MWMAELKHGEHVGDLPAYAPAFKEVYRFIVEALGVMKSLRRGYSASIWPGKCQRSYLALRAAVKKRSKATVSTIRSQGRMCQHWPHEAPWLGWLGGGDV